MIGGLFPSGRILAASSSDPDSFPLAQYWHKITDHLAESLISIGRFGTSTVYIDKKHTALDVAQYLEQQLSVSLRKSYVEVTSPINARYVIELDVVIRELSNGVGTLYVEGGDIDEFWEIKEIKPVYSDQFTRYEMTPLTMKRPVTINPLSGADTEVIITARILERGLILAAQSYAFYFSAEQARREKKPLQKRISKAEDAEDGDADVDALFMELQNQQSAFLNYQKRLDNHIQPLVDSYLFDINF
ncbi:hypothetical protein [Endozoicomonas sp. SCSIO W0465]|uniref:hypothetical protein n=1 Tax=Endozoicomonas sp. SCSIO W0465 TaxID=2918516 RepID=UPI0020762F2C|nr:hypothetical protein [Endozoicomonas sp. SCSIO W0465]USE38148.1 hypothetical protein MJO57_08255 [Endozoicomonas sp. SCSIO W0465]